MTLGSDVQGSALYTTLVGDITIPNVNLTTAEFDVPGGTESHLYQVIEPIQNSAITSGSIDGSGAFDVMMTGFSAHLKEEYDRGRLTGADYAKAFVALTEVAMVQSVQFVVARDAAYWQSVDMQAKAILGRINVEHAKLAYSATRAEAMDAAAKAALGKIKLAAEDVAYAIAKFQLETTEPYKANLLVAELNKVTGQDLAIRAEASKTAYETANLLPAQLAKINSEKGGQDTLNSKLSYEVSYLMPTQRDAIIKQSAGQDVTNSKLSYELANLLPAQLSRVTAEKTGVDTANSLAAYRLAYIAPLEVAKLSAEKVEVDNRNSHLTYQLSYILPQQAALVSEQTEAQRAATADTRRDGSTVAGLVQRQKDLYSQQVTSYQRDVDIKTAKLFSEAWITMKSIDEGLAAPGNFTNDSINAVLASLKTRTAMG